MGESVQHLSANLSKRRIEADNDKSKQRQGNAVQSKPHYIAIPSVFQAGFQISPRHRFKPQSRSGSNDGVTNILPLIAWKVRPAGVNDSSSRSKAQLGPWKGTSIVSP